MLTIRLQRVGRRNQAAFRVVLAEKHRHVKKKAVEILGHYDPKTKELGIKDEERVKYWIGQHVEVSPSVHNLFVEKGLLQGEKVKAWRPKVKKVKEDKAHPPKISEEASAGKGNAPKEKAETTEDAGETKEVEKKSSEDKAAPPPSAEGSESRSAGVGIDKKE